MAEEFVALKNVHTEEFRSLNPEVAEAGKRWREESRGVTKKPEDVKS